MERQYTVALGHTVAAQDVAIFEMVQRHAHEMDGMGSQKLRGAMDDEDQVGHLDEILNKS